METRKTYKSDGKGVILIDVAQALASRADSTQDCLGVLCELSGEGAWAADEEGRQVYRAVMEAEERRCLTETGFLPIETYAPGDHVIPTRVARKLGLGERVVCQSAGYLLQGEKLIKRNVYRAGPEYSEDGTVVATTLYDILLAEVDDDEWASQEVYWKDLEWRHIQMVLDVCGGQRDRFVLLSEILDHIGEVSLMEGTYIPYGYQFADSDFIDSL